MTLYRFRSRNLSPTAGSFYPHLNTVMHILTPDYCVYLRVPTSWEVFFPSHLIQFCLYCKSRFTNIFYDKLDSLLLASVNIQMTLSECTWFKLSSCLLVWTTNIMKLLSIAICKSCWGRPSWAPYNTMLSCLMSGFVMISNGPPPESINHTYTCVTACVSACVWQEKRKGDLSIKLNQGRCW